MRRIKGKVIAVCTVIAVILAAKAALTAEIPVVYAENRSDIDDTAVLEADGEDEQDTENSASGDGDETDGEDKSDADSTDGDADKAGGGVNSGTDSAADSQTDGGNKTDSKPDAGTDDAEADSDADVKTEDDTLVDAEEEPEETPEETLPLTGMRSVFSLRSSRSTGEPVPISNESDLNSALNGTSPVNVKLMDNITITDLITLEGEDVTIDLDGKKITADTNAFIVFKGTLTITGNGTIEAGDSAIVVGGGNCKIENGTIKSTKESAVEVNGGAVTISDGSFTGNPYGIHVLGGNATIKGGKFEGVDACLVDGSDASVSIEGGTFTAYSGKGLRINAFGEKAELKGGTFSSGIAVKLERETQRSGLPVGEWAKCFYNSIASGRVLTNNTFSEEGVEEQIFYASAERPIGFKSGSWDGSCTEIRNLSGGTTYSFGEGKWTVDGDDAVYSAGDFCVPSGGIYTFTKK